MDKKIKNIQELMKKYEECKVLVDIRKKWTSEEIENLITLKICIDSGNPIQSENGEKVIKQIIDYLNAAEIEKVAVVKSGFRGYESENPSLEIIIPDKGQVVFGDVSAEKVVEILKRYLIENDEIVKFLEKNR